MPRPGTTLFWFRRNLRLKDHPALRAAFQQGNSVVPVFIWSPQDDTPWAPGAASRWWLHGSLAVLQRQIERQGGRLILERGSIQTVFRRLVRQTGAQRVVWVRGVDPGSRQQDQALTIALRSWGVEAMALVPDLLHEPERWLNSQGRAYQIFTPFWNRWLREAERVSPSAVQVRGAWARTKLPSWNLDDLGLRKDKRLHVRLSRNWTPGETAARSAWARFCQRDLSGYPRLRDQLGKTGTSALSPRLHWGELSVHAIREYLETIAAARPEVRVPALAFLRQLVWREFAHHVLWHFPQLPDRPLKPGFDQVAWQDRGAAEKAWQRGETGFPLVDAGMRELLATGFMHNRARMVTASFLVKDLLIDWRAGERWFWEHLVDADLANNAFGWQWVAGCGADAAPYFRVFNPTLQSQRFDPQGSYLARWLPELRQLKPRWRHGPDQAPIAVLKAAEVKLGKTYPWPAVEHAHARRRALRVLRPGRKQRSVA